MSLQSYLDKARVWGSDFASYLAKTFLRSGNTGYAKLAFTSLIGLWGLHFFARHYGLLPKKSVKGSHIFITGAGSGLGRQMSFIFAKLGAKISVVDINLQAAQAVEKALTEQGYPAKAIYCDVSDSQSVKEAAKTAIETFGDVEILINNAGVVSGKKLLENNEKMIEKTVQVNTISHAYTVREFLPGMLQKNKGHIVTVASIAGMVGVTGLADYCASKYGAVGFDESLRMELRQLKTNVKTTCICPYFIHTGMFEGAKSRFNFLLPISTEDYASRRIVNAILQEEKVTIFPFMCHLLPVMRGLLPIWAFDTLCDLFGVNKSMEHFVGRKTA